MKFELTEEQNKRLTAWLTKQETLAIAKQKETITESNNWHHVYASSWDQGYAYGGAIGGFLTYSFTPTSIGLVTKVTHAITKETIDLSDYEDW